MVMICNSLFASYTYTHTYNISTMSLADELMNDLDGLSDGGESNHEDQVAGPSSHIKTTGDSTAAAQEDDINNDDGMMSPAREELEAGKGATVGSVPSGGTRPAEELDRDEVEHMNLQTVADIDSVVKLHKSKRLQEALSVSSCYPAFRAFSLMTFADN